jgi:penicillin-binding protein-related factor A (putative recombinase)
MANSESLLWKQIKTALSNQGYFLTRIETLTVSGVPDVFGIYKGTSFWCELKSNPVNYPALNKYQIVWINRAVKHGGVVMILVKAQKERALQIYRIKDFFTDPRSLSPDYVIKIPIRWPLFVDKFTSALLT